MMHTEDTYALIPMEIRRLLKDFLDNYTPSRLSPASTHSPKNSNNLASFLLPMAFNKTIPMHARMVILQSYRYTMNMPAVPQEFVSNVIESIRSETCPNWINEVLTICLAFCVETPQSQSKFQCKKFFKSIQAAYPLAQYKAGMLLVNIINQELSEYFDRDFFTRDLLESSFGIIKNNLAVLMAYAAGYKRIKESKESELSKQKDAGLFTAAESEIDFIFMWLARSDKSALVFPALIFLTESATEAMQSMERKLTFSMIIRKEMNLIAADPENSVIYLRLNHFLEKMLSLSNKCKHITAELEYIDVLMHRIETELSQEIFSAETYSSLAVLKVLARTQIITVNYLSSNRMENLLEKIIVLAYTQYIENPYEELSLCINELFLYLGNLVVYNQNWKEAAITRIMPHVRKYFYVIECKESLLKFLQDILFECTPSVSRALFPSIQIDEIRGKAVTLKHKILFMSILKNLLANAHNSEKVEILVESALVEVTIIIDTTIKPIITASDEQKVLLSKLCQEILLIIANIVIISPPHGVKHEIIKTAIYVFKQAGTHDAFLAFLAYLTNTAYIPNLPQNSPNHMKISQMEITKKSATEWSGFTNIPLETINTIMGILKEWIGKDTVIDFKIKSFLGKIRSTKNK
ncbi:hypothetical protein NEAUS06_2434 [Nematocida ausubeli]|nr:hypothetical protein NEAUS06_2434 [Nematocida ausubeli]